MIGKTLSHYRLVERIAAGGMGVVHRARDERLGRDVALKVLPAGALADDAMRERFRREALALSRLNHPHIATIHDLDREDGVDFLVMEYIPGRTVAQMIAGGPMGESEAATIACQIVEALEEAHEQGIVHGDLKSENVIVTPKGWVKVLDFGLATLRGPLLQGAETTVYTAESVVAGTLPYMAPEQLLRGTTDARTDLYALGIVLYEMLTGTTPFEAPELSLFDLMERIVKEPAPKASERKPGVPAAFDAILARALAKRPAERFQRAHDFAEALRALRSGAELAAEVEYSLGEDSGSRETLSRLLGDLEISSRTDTPETLSASLRQGFHYLEALVRRVVQASPPFTVSLDLAQVGVLPAAALGAGKVESRTRLLQGKEVVDSVTLDYRMRSAKKARAALGGEDARRLKARLERAGIAFEHREVRDAAGVLRCEAFVIEVDMPARATLRADYEAQAVDIECSNVGVLGPARYRLSRAEFDELMWDFGKLVLGFPSAFAGRRLPS